MHIMSRSHTALFAGFMIAVGTFAGCSEDPMSSQNIDDPPALDGFPQVSPEEVGFSSERLRVARDQFDRIGSAAFMALHDGRVFVAWGHVDRRYRLHSIRKPLLGALYGIHVTGGAIDTAATLAELGIDDIPPSLTAAEKQARVADLLRSRSGVYHEAAAEHPIMIEERPERGSHPPGTFYYYNNWDFNALGTIFEQETGTEIFDEFERAIAIPVGMQDFRVEDGHYGYELDRSIHPAYHFRMSARDLARFGVLFQKNGSWGGRQIVPHDWIAASWTPYSMDDEEFGIAYGMLWGVALEDSPMGSAALHAGIGVHYLVIVPDQKLVFVHRVNTDQPWSITSEDVQMLLELVFSARSPN
jgi:CubicO group peptidase (beta-lactamase class C family)